MKSLPQSTEMQHVARRVIWFEDPAEALSDPQRFIAYAMTFAVHEDMNVVRQHVTDDDLRDVLDNAPPGIIDPRSWSYWHLKLGKFPAPAQPLRTLGEP